MKRLLFFIAFMSLATAGLIRLVVTEPNEALRMPPPPRRNVETVLNMEGVHVRQLVNERLRWDLRAKRAIYDEGTDLGRLSEVHFQVYDVNAPPSAKPVMEGQSRSAQLDSRDGQVVLEGGVVLSRGSDVEIHSERIEYDDAEQIVASPGRVRVQSAQGVQEGTSMRYDIARQRMDFRSPVFYQ